MKTIDENLIEFVKTNNTLEANRLFRIIYDEVYSFVQSVLRRFDNIPKEKREEIFNDVFIVVFEKRKKFRGKNMVSFYAWLRFIAANKCIDAYRKGQSNRTIQTKELEDNDVYSFEEETMRWSNLVYDFIKLCVKEFNLFSGSIRGKVFLHEMDNYHIKRSERYKTFGLNQNTYGSHRYYAEKIIKTNIQKLYICVEHKTWNNG